MTDLPPPDLEPTQEIVSPSVGPAPTEWSDVPFWLRTLGSEQAWDALDSVGKLLESNSTLSPSTTLVRSAPDLELPSTRFVGKRHPTRVALARLGVSFLTQIVPESS